MRCGCPGFRVAWWRNLEVGLGVLSRCGSALIGVCAMGRARFVRRWYGAVIAACTQVGVLWHAVWLGWRVAAVLRAAGGVVV